jgi:hypothetical protein
LVSAAFYGALATIDVHTLDFTAQFGVLRCLAAFYLGVAVYRLHAMHGRRLSSIAWLESVTLAASVVSVSLADRSLYTWVECRGRDASRCWVSNWRSGRHVSSGKA